MIALEKYFEKESVNVEEVTNFILDNREIKIYSSTEYIPRNEEEVGILKLKDCLSPPMEKPIKN